MSEHTPGPWRSVEFRRDGILHVGVGAMPIGSHVICILELGEKHQEANARLIAAAPELFESAAKLVHAMKLIGFESSLIDDVQMALSKAKAISQSSGSLTPPSEPQTPAEQAASCPVNPDGAFLPPVQASSGPNSGVAR